MGILCNTNLCYLGIIPTNETTHKPQKNVPLRAGCVLDKSDPAGILPDQIGYGAINPQKRNTRKQISGDE